ncbi:hypothetical protein IEQ34_004684 [Dendrobium chrysotoxum]|uniref:Uncharacterized protein n=1 Tax=Dendrobium chrysotoxum TaxID=161865 RepID=A0AAV7HEK8_DENCH|nr:hypothetical protein IEQ34_004684 [Dendrobium chrysotoxum]
MDVPNYSLKNQYLIVIATMALHNSVNYYSTILLIYHQNIILIGHESRGKIKLETFEIKFGTI